MTVKIQKNRIKKTGIKKVEEKPLYCALRFDSDKKNQSEKRPSTETILLSWTDQSEAAQKPTTREDRWPEPMMIVSVDRQEI